ncbi:hypothetical protein MHBO_003850 [Bonamia ostreae]|uniref:Phospholipase A(2) n=1 Tax=Bonamia ostreae TaxID=126728 RepID=A0ABV2ASJ1_9EUKA
MCTFIISLLSLVSANQLLREKWAANNGWSCGAEPISYFLSHRVWLGCQSQTFVELNHCCYDHDFCYDYSSYSYSECDDIFALCIRMVDKSGCSLAAFSSYAVITSVNKLGYMFKTSFAFDFSNL